MMKLRRKYKAEGVMMIKAHKCIRPLLCIKSILFRIYEIGLEMKIKFTYRILINILSLNKNTYLPNYEINNKALNIQVYYKRLIMNYLQPKRIFL